MTAESESKYRARAAGEAYAAVCAAHAQNPGKVSQAAVNWVCDRAFEEFRKDAAERATAQTRHEQAPVAGAGIQPR